MEIHQENKALGNYHHRPKAKERKEFSRDDEFTLSRRCNPQEMLREIKKSGNSFD
jgi:hypothetical protein